MDKKKNLDALLQSFVDSGLPGCSLMITKHGETVYEGYAGWADVENKVPVTRDSLFRQASMSKIPLYTTMMMLYERGLYLMDDPISKYLPEWENTRKFVMTSNGTLKIVPTDGPITIKDCLTMRCGLPYCNSPAPTTDPVMQSMQECMKPLWEKGHYTVQEHIAAMSKAVLAFEPGTHWMYGFASEITAALIEKIAGKPIDDVFAELIFEPLGMDSTRSRYFEGAPERMVKLYAKGEDGGLVPTRVAFDNKHLPGPENETGWARIFSNVSDFSKLMSMLANGGVYEGKRIMGRKSIDLMRTNCLTPEQFRDFDDSYNAGYGYGYGFRTLMDKNKGNHNGSIGAFGWTGGFGTWCEADPEEGVSIVYMHNLIPNMEKFYHLRMRSAAYGFLD